MTAEEAGAPEHRPSHRRSRLWATRGLVALASLLLVVGVLAVWVKRVALQSDTWGTTSGRILEDRQVQQTLSTYLVDQLYSRVDVASQLRDALPAQAKPLAGPAAAGLRDFVDRAALRALAAPRVQTLWRTANERANRQVVLLLDGGGNRLSTTNGEVVLDLHPLLEQVVGRAGIADRVGRALPPTAGRIVLLRSDQLKLAQDAAKALRVVADFVAFLAIAIFALAIWAAPDRRKGLRACAIGVLAASLVLVFVRRVLGDELIDRLVPSDSIRPAAHQVWWISTDQLRLANTTLFVVGLVGLLGAWVAGPGRRARETRRALAPFLREPLWAYGAFGALVLVLLAWAPTPAARTLTTAVILIVLSAVGLELLRRQTAREYPDADRQAISVSLPRRAAVTNGGGVVVPAAEDLRLSRLERLAELRARGVLSDEEFLLEKQQLLATETGSPGPVPIPPVIGGPA